MNQPESATIWATMENSNHPEYGVVTIPFPIPRESYDSYMEKLQAMGIGDPLKRDCRVVSILSDYSVLKQLEIMTVKGKSLTPQPKASAKARSRSLKRYLPQGLLFFLLYSIINNKGKRCKGAQT